MHDFQTTRLTASFDDSISSLTLSVEELRLIKINKMAKRTNLDTKTDGDKKKFLNSQLLHQK